MSRTQAGQRVYATVAGVQIALTPVEWSVISAMLRERAGVECAAPATRIVARLARKGMVRRGPPVAGVAGAVYVLTDLARAFAEARRKAAIEAQERASRRAARRLRQSAAGAEG